MPIFSSFSSTPARAIGTTSASKPGRPFNIFASDIGTGRAFNNGAATVSFEHKGVKANFFTVTSFPGNVSATGASSPIVVEGLNSNTSYTFTVTATNSIGTSKISDISNSITSTTVPQAPTLNSATNNNRTSVARATFSANSNGGKSITSYTARESGNISQSGSSSPIDITGLTAGQTYSVTVTATNANGTSLPSNSINVTTFNATGGSITTSGAYRIHTFTGNGTFATTGSSNVEYLCVAGAGGGGFNGGGGGGGGGVLTSNWTANGSYSITVGGGAPGLSTGGTPSKGINSSISSVVTTEGGGGGGSRTATPSHGPGGNGGSGGGAGGQDVNYSGGTGVAGPPRQGYNGGNNRTGGSLAAGGGGGGATANGSNATLSQTGGNGAEGLSSSISGTAIVVGSGGGGGAVVGSQPKAPGGTNAGAGSTGVVPRNGSDGVANRGGGGGGGGEGATGGTGGSGIVIVRYLI